MDIITISGLGSSGSSAIIDYLYDNTNITGFFMDYPSETSILNSSFLGDFYNFFKENSDTKINIYDLVLYLTGGQIGQTKSQNSTLVLQFVSNNLDSNYNQHKLDLINNLKKNEHILLRKNKNIINISDEIIDSIIARHFKELNYNLNQFLINYEKLVKLLLLQCKYPVIFNNDIDLWVNNNLIEIECNKSLLVIRYPLDQYLRSSLFVVNKSKMYKLFRFIIEFNYKAIKIIISLKKKLIIINFEDFLKSQELRESIIEYLQLDTKIKNTRLFNLNYSLQGIRSYIGKLSLFEVIALKIFTLPAYKLLQIKIHKF